MKVKILGCSGGIGGIGGMDDALGGAPLRTTAMLVDHDILIDAGTGVGDLSLEELLLIDHVFITHSHLDHIACLPLILDAVGDQRQKPLKVYATAQTQDILKTHLFNNLLWPNFYDIPSHEHPYAQPEIVQVGQTVDLSGRMITPLPAHHTVPAVAYQLDSGHASLVFTGDTTSQNALWQAVNQIHNLRYLIIETAYPNCDRPLAVLAKHLCPSLLAEELKKWTWFHTQQPELFITHLKPGQQKMTMQEIEASLSQYAPRRLVQNQVFEF